MSPTSARSHNPSVQEKQAVAAVQRLAKNVATNEAVAKKRFSDETWVGIDSIKLDYVTLPKDATDILVAKLRLPINKQEELDFLKEIISATKLIKLGASVTLIPRIKRPDGKGFLPGPDAIVNGTLFEFKTITGRLDKVGARFRDSREQGNNVYIRIENPNLTKPCVVRYLVGFINNPEYQGGYKGNLILTLGTGDGEKTYFYRISDFKK